MSCYSSARTSHSYAFPVLYGYVRSSLSWHHLNGPQDTVHGQDYPWKCCDTRYKVWICPLWKYGWDSSCLRCDALREATHLTTNQWVDDESYCHMFRTLNGRAKKGIIGDEYPRFLKRSLIMWSRLGTIFYLSYLVFEFPQNLCLQRFPVGKWMRCVHMLSA